MTEPLWVSVGRMLEGIAEIPGPASNPIILRWGQEIHTPVFTNDDTAWCAVYANRLAVACQFPLSGTGYELLRARSFMTWGQRLDYEALGAWMVFWRPEGAHVGLYLGETDSAYWIHGGNTGNRVGAAWLAKSRLIARRWPVGVVLPAVGPVLLDAPSVPLSTNET